MNKMKNNDKGFTLVELVIVIAILAVLALLLVPRIGDYINEARRSADLADARTIVTEISTHNALAIANGESEDDVIKSSSDGWENVDPENVKGLIDSSLTGKIAEIHGRDYARIQVDDEGNVQVKDVTKAGKDEGSQTD